MITLPPTSRAFLCTRPVDMRKGFDGLPGLVRSCFAEDLLSGHLFLFVNSRGDRLKALYFDRDGLAVWYKRLEAGTFQVPPLRRLRGHRAGARPARHDPLRRRPLHRPPPQAIPRRILTPGSPGTDAPRRLIVVKISI
ncbi:IS66 Orf2 like protein [Aquisphaera giovannonii]|uniref:IS66 Orf2 like protein n=1 Tax=Aquisphaera giovannonii TaxID=406548 RepID=A0A5B9WEH6_9BACT|nr:IS66 family insertion sequence element accessory protein TnpB [Aquisphaera giovannonii]QEH38614.1 IS66 Orf2 like protein [Aquisphaera giovannonii]